MAATAAGKPRKRCRLFKGEKMDLTHRVGFLGASMSGKTRGLYDFLLLADFNHKREHGHGIQIAFGFSRTEDGNGNLGGPVRDNNNNVISKYALMPSMFATTGFSQERLEEIMDYQMKTKKAGRGKECMIIFDDVFNGKGMNRNPVLDQLAQNGRNGMMGMYVAGHKMKQWGTGVRSTLHYVVVYDLSKKEVEDFRLEFAAELFDTNEELWSFWKALRKRKGKYWAMVIDVKNTANSAVFSDRVFVFSSRDPSAPDYFIPHFCERGFWWLQHQLECADKDEVDLAGLFDLGDIAQARGLHLDDRNKAALLKTSRARKTVARQTRMLAASVLDGIGEGGRSTMDHAEVMEFA